MDNQSTLLLMVRYSVAAEWGLWDLAVLLAMGPALPSALGLTVGILLCQACHQPMRFCSYSLALLSSEDECCCAKESRRNIDFEVYAKTQIIL